MANLRGRLALAEMAQKLGILAVDEGLLAEGDRLLATAGDLVNEGTLSYGLLVARKADGGAAEAE